MDGIDAALVRTDGHGWVEPLGFIFTPYRRAFRDRLRAVLGGVGDVTGVEAELTDLHAEAVESLLRVQEVAADLVDLIGFHGHTILHAPDRRHTWQIGNGARLAATTGIDVVHDFRTNDVAAGGQGAPLVPLYHQALAGDLDRPLAILNIGGVANITWLGEGPLDVVAFDTGPGNALIDDLILARTGEPYDDGGRIAGSGAVDQVLLGRLLNHVYFAAPPPKSLDRDAWSRAALNNLSTEDAAATLTAFTAESIIRALDHLPARPKRWLICGGGRRNETLMWMLADRLGGAPVSPVDGLGWNGDALEAEAFAYLAVRSRLGLPLSLPGTTGVPEPLTGGKFHPRPWCRCHVRVRTTGP